jgi:hypothetical protein
LEKVMKVAQRAQKMKFESAGYLIDAPSFPSLQTRYFLFLQKTFLRSFLSSEDKVPELL